MYFKIIFKGDYVCEVKINYNSFNEETKMFYISGFNLLENDATDLQLKYRQSETVKHPFEVSNLACDFSLENGHIGNGFYKQTIINDETEYEIPRGFKKFPTPIYTDITTPSKLHERFIFKNVNNFSISNQEGIYSSTFDTFCDAVPETQSSIGFWIKLSDVKDNLILTYTGAIRMYLPFNFLSLGEYETTDYKIRIIDKEGEYYYINFINKVHTSININIGYLSANLITTELNIGGLTMVEGSHNLNGRIRYKTSAENLKSKVIDKSVCMVGDSTTADLVLIRRFAKLSGCSETFVAAVSGASIGNDTVTNWIYTYKDFIITSNADYTIYNISSNDTNNSTGTAADVDDANVNDSFYKYYFQFMRYIMTNQIAIAGTPVLNLQNKGHFMCTWLTGDDSGQPNRRKSSIDKNKVVDELSRYWSANFIDIHRSVGWTEESSSFYGDGTHPNHFIHNRIANKIIREINY